MNLLKSSLPILLFYALTFSQAQYDGITQTREIPKKSNIVVSSDYPCTLASGVRNYNGWNRVLSWARYSVMTPNASLNAIAKGKLSFKANGKDSTGKTASATCVENIPNQNPMLLAGYNVVRLFPFNYVKQTIKNPGMFANGILSTDEDINQLDYHITDEIEASKYLNSIKSGTKLTFMGYTSVTPSSVTFKSGNTTVNGQIYLSEYKKQLLNAFGGNVFKDAFLAKNGNGTVFPFAIFHYGETKIAYAMYGVFKDQNKASLYGFNAGDRVFFTEKEILPDVFNGAPNYALWPAFQELGVDPKLSFGRNVYSYDQVMQDSKNIYPNLAWRETPIWSEMPKVFDAAGNVQVVSGTNELPPSAPDNENNTNPLQFMSCPDRDFYFDLYYKCVTKEMTVDEYQLNHPNNYGDYKDYLKSKEMANYDASIYYEDHSLSQQTATTSNPPAEPALYNKDGTLLNRDAHTYADPWDPATKFYLYWRDWHFSVFEGWTHTYETRDLTAQARGAIQACLDIYEDINKDPYALETQGKITIDWADKSLKDSAIYIGNPVDYFNPYKNAKEFCNYDNSYVENGGNPFRTQSYKSGQDDEWFGEYNQDNAKDWYLSLNWTLVFKNRKLQKFTVATVRFKQYFWSEEGKLMRTNEEQSVNRFFTTDNPNHVDAEFDKYDKNSKDYHTDQSDVSDRNNKISKGEAMATIARKIAVAEGLNFLVKALFAQSDKSPYLQAAYEGTKRIENNIGVKKTYSLALKAYQAYVLWAQTMDILAEVRDTYNSIGPAWDGLLSSLHNVYDYYSHLDISRLRLTNCTMLLPRSTLMNLDWSIYRLQSSLSNFNLALDALAFQSDRFSDGNYGPFNKYINYAYGELSQATMTSGASTASVLDKTTANMDKAKNQSRSNSSDAAYLSNLTRATHNIITNQDSRVLNERVRTMSMALFLVESDSRQWILYKNHMKNIVTKTPGKIDESQRDGSYMPLVKQFDDPRYFDDRSSKALENLAE